MSSNQHNRYKASVHIDLGGKPRTLVYDMNALIIIQDHLNGERLKNMSSQDTKDDLIEDMTKIMKTGGFRYVRVTVWAGLLRHEPTLTLEDVGRMDDIIPKMAEITKKIEGVFNKLFPEQNDNELQDDSKKKMIQMNSKPGKS